MGRTNPTYRDLLRAIEDRWQPYRRTLRRADQPRFDRLLVYARDHADAAGTLNHEDRLAPVLVSVALEQERRLDELASHLDEQERRLDELASRSDGRRTDTDDREPPEDASRAHAEPDE
jgi:uncharacterized membrane protein YccC